MTTTTQMHEAPSARLDDANRRFTQPVKDSLRRLEGFSDGALEWLMLEHYQFSNANVGFLGAAAAVTAPLAEKGVAEELLRNRREEDGHAAMYRRALAEAGSPVERRQPFAPTARFLQEIGRLTEATPSRVLGTMYATETAAIFEHEVFWDVSREVCARRGIAWEDSALRRFHGLHLEGVEQGHKDGLGVFIDAADAPGGPSRGEPVDTAQVDAGVKAAIATMAAWWDALLREARAR